MADLLQVLLDMRNGGVAVDCNTKFTELTEAVLKTGMKGELTLKLIVKPSRMAMGGAVVEVEVEHECRAKRPELPLGKSTFFVTQDGHLTREDPSMKNQDSLFQIETENENVDKR